MKVLSPCGPWGRRDDGGVEYKGYTGTIEIASDELIIHREGLSRIMSSGAATRRVPLSAISDVVIHPATRLTNGWITVGTMGNSARHLGSGTAASDPDTVLFRHRDAEAFNALYEWLKSVVVINSSPGAQSANPALPSAPENGSSQPAPAPEEVNVPTALKDRSSVAPGTQEDRIDRSRPVGAWHPDPFGRFQYRYWDGTGWTDRVSTNGSSEVDALGTGPQSAESSAPLTVSSPQDAPTGSETKPAEAAPGFFQRRREEKAAKAAERDAFEALALRAAHGDLTALSLLPGETEKARSLYGAREFDRRRFEVIASAVRTVIDDDVLTEAEEEQIARLLAPVIHDLRCRRLSVGSAMS